MKKYLLFLLPAVLLYSCGIQMHTTMTLNPDMSGKTVAEEKIGVDLAQVIVDTKGSDAKSLYSNPFGGTGDTTSMTPNEVAMAYASKMLSAKGIDAWKDVEYGLTAGGDTVYFKGTAYFKDLTKLGVSMLDSMIQVSKTADGDITLSFKTGNDHKSDSLSAAMSALGGKSMFKGGVWTAMMHCYMAAMMRGFEVSSTYHLPGKIISSSNFIRKDESTVAISITGDQIIKLMDAPKGGNNNMALMQLMGASSNPNSYNSFLFGQDKPVEVTYKPDTKPQFDYDKEVAEAKKSYTAFRKKSGIDKYDSVQAVIAAQKEEEAEREHGKLVVTAKDSANGKVYFKKLSIDQFYGTMTFSGELSRGVNAGYSGYVTITKAYTDKGVSVLDSIQGHDSLSAFISPDSYSFTDTTTAKKKVSFSVVGNFPEDCKILNLEGRVVIDASTSIPFKIVNLYVKPKEESSEDYDKYK